MSEVSSLNLPQADRQHFNKNYLASVVVEFKFPTLLEIAENLPVDLQKSVRGQFPHYERAHLASLTPHGSDHVVSHEFRTKSKKELVRLTQNSLSVTTYKYESYETFKDLAESVVEAFVPHLDTNFFTRVGLRYINKINTPNIRSEVSQWINQSLVDYISKGVISRIQDLKMEIGGDINESSKFHFRCGLVPKVTGANGQPSDTVEFLLDYDYYSEDVEVLQVGDLMDKYHDVNFNFFWWSLGHKAKEDLLNA